MLKSLVASVVLFTACSKKPAPVAPAEPAPVEPAPAATTETPPAAEDAASPEPAAPGQPNKCTTSGGKCGSKFAMNACKKFEEAPEWGCGANQGCCL